MTPPEVQQLLMKRTLQRDMLLWAASAYLDAGENCSAKAIEKSKETLKNAVALVEAEL